MFIQSALLGILKINHAKYKPTKPVHYRQTQVEQLDLATGPGE